MKKEIEENSLEEINFKTGENLICSVKQNGFSIYAFKGEKPDEIDVVVRDELNQDVLCTGTIYHDNGDIDCFIGNMNKNKVVMPLIKELEKFGYTYH